MGQDIKLRQPVSVVAVDRLGPVAARVDVVNRAGEFEAQLAGHGRSLADLGNRVTPDASPVNPRTEQIDHLAYTVRHGRA